jgi:hypothetical protein
MGGCVGVDSVVAAEGVEAGAITVQDEVCKTERAVVAVTFRLSCA